MEGTDTGRVEKENAELGFTCSEFAYGLAWGSREQKVEELTV